MGYATWTIGTEVIPHVREAKINTQEGTITLSCSALNWNIETGDDDPRDEIARIQALTSQYIHNEPLLNGGTKLQIGNGQIVTVTDGTDTYTRCALEPVQIQEDHKSTKRIDYDIIIHYQLTGTGGSYVYSPSYYDYTNMEYYEWYYLVGETWTKANATEASGAYGTEIGWMEITETLPVSKVELYGSACVLPATVTVTNSVEGTQSWHYEHDNNTNQPFEQLTFTFPSDQDITTLTIYTSGHDPDDDPNSGAWIKWIRVTYK